MATKSGKGRQFLQNTLTVIISCIVFFTLGEIVFRAMYPEYRNHIRTDDMSMGQRRHKNVILGGQTRSRTKDLDIQLKPGDHAVFVFGDSVTYGYGLAYEDIFWNYWQRMLDLEDSKTKIICITAYGNNTLNNIQIIRDTVSAAKAAHLNIDGLIYQFNFNDILPFTSEDIKDMKHLGVKNSWISKAILKLAYARAQYLNHSVMLRVLSNKLTYLLYNNKNVACEDLGSDGLGDYTYSFGAKNSLDMANKLWANFETDLTKLLSETRPVPFVLLITPIPQFLEPQMVVHSMSRPKRFDCAAIDPVDRLTKMSEKLNFHLVDPTAYMKKYFENYAKEGNPVRFFHMNDDNHFSEIGSKYFTEYSYEKIFNEGIVRSFSDNTTEHAKNYQ